MFKKENTSIEQQPSQQSELDLISEKTRKEIQGMSDRCRELAELNVLDAKLVLDELEGRSKDRPIDASERLMREMVTEYLNHNLDVATNKEMTPPARIENLSQNSFYKTVNRSLTKDRDYNTEIEPNVSPDNPAFVDRIADKVFFQKFNRIKRDTDERINRADRDERMYKGIKRNPMTTEQRHAEAKEAAINYLKGFTNGSTSSAVELFELLNTKMEGFSPEQAVEYGHNPAFISKLYEDISYSVCYGDVPKYIGEDSKIYGYIKELAKNETKQLFQNRKNVKDKDV